MISATGVLWDVLQERLRRSAAAVGMPAALPILLGAIGLVMLGLVRGPPPDPLDRRGRVLYA
jgi:hypothetical protein